MPPHLADNIDFGAAVLGGIIIGIASTGFLLASGKLTGLSGFVETAITPRSKIDEKIWVWSYIIGMMLAGLGASYIDRDRLGITAEVRYSTLLAGLLVGFGTRMGCGCTSGHGISGLPRGSLRALVAVCTFMISAVISAICSRVLQNNGVFPLIGHTVTLPYWPPIFVVIFLPLISFVVVYLGLSGYYNYLHDSSSETPTPSNALWLRETNIQHSITALIVGFVFGVGLSISGMCDPKRVIHFLDFPGPDGWDPSLAGVMFAGVLFNFISFHLLHRYEVGVLIQTQDEDRITLNNVLKLWHHPANMHLPMSFIVGGILFGIGWGLAGICPGPAIINLAASSRVSAAFLCTTFIGMAMHEVYKTFDTFQNRLNESKSHEKVPLLAP